MIYQQTCSNNYCKIKSIILKYKLMSLLKEDELAYLKFKGMKTKSGIMLGLGEKENEVIKTMDDLRNIGVDVMTIGQYLQPTKKHLPVKDFVHPDVFKKYKELGLEKGFRFVESGPLVRSSYHAEKHLF